jgi:hypothetical protein
MSITREGLTDGLPVEGYRPQTDQAIDLVNENKRLEETILRRLDELRELAIQAEDGGNNHLIDFRWFSIARTHIEQGFMALNRSIFQPSRVSMPWGVGKPEE